MQKLKYSYVMWMWKFVQLFSPNVQHLHSFWDNVNKSTNFPWDIESYNASLCFFLNLFRIIIGRRILKENAIECAINAQVCFWIVIKNYHLANRSRPKTERYIIGSTFTNTTPARAIPSPNHHTYPSFHKTDNLLKRDANVEVYITFVYKCSTFALV